MIFFANIQPDFLAKRFSVNILRTSIVQKQTSSLNLTVQNIIRQKANNTIKKEPLFWKSMA